MGKDGNNIDPNVPCGHTYYTTTCGRRRRVISCQLFAPFKAKRKALSAEIAQNHGDAKSALSSHTRCVTRIRRQGIQSAYHLYSRDEGGGPMGLKHRKWS